MADVTISQLTRGVPSGNNLLPYSTGSNTLGVPISAIFQNANSIGIGTSNYTPCKLHILETGIYDEVLRLSHSGSNNTYIYFYAGSSLDAYGELSFSRTNLNQGDLYYGGYATGRHVFRSNNYNEKMVIDSSGNVGIGTSAPKGNLDIVDSASLCGTLFKSLFVNFLTGPATKYLKIILNSSISVTMDATLRGQFNYLNASGAYRKIYSIDSNTNPGDLNLYGYGTSVAVNIGFTNTYFDMGDATKININTITIPITRKTGPNNSFPNGAFLGLRLEGYGVSNIASISIVDSV